MFPLIVFFLSGFAALVYQVIWQRLLVIFSGADVYSVTIIVAAFMAGLGVGSLAGGVAADRLGVRTNFLAFAVAELLIGMFGLGSKWLFYDTLYTRYPHLAASHAQAAAVLFASLLIPTFLMGVSLPLLSRGVAGSLRVAPRVIASLYGCNTLGAAFGAAATTWVLVPAFGLDRSLRIAAALNVICAVLAIRLAMSAPPAPDGEATRTMPSAPDATDAVTSDISVLPFRTWSVLYALTGFVALGLEIAWFRFLGVLLKSTSFTFGTLLAVYLAGLGAGAVVGARRVRRSRRPGLMCLALQYGVAAYAALSVTAVIALIGAGHPIKLVRFLGSYEPPNVHEILSQAMQLGWFSGDAAGALVELAVLYIVVPAVLIGPPTFLMGLGFAYLQKASLGDLRHVGRHLGILLASNIVGGVLGTVLTGWLLLPSLGTSGTFKALVMMCAVLAWPFARLLWPDNGRRRLFAVLGAAFTTAVLVLSIPASDRLWARLHATAPSHILFDEDGAGLSLLKFSGTNSQAVEVYVNGLGQSWLPYGNIHTALGALPAFIHPAPTEMALIGLGSGDTAFAALGRPALQRLTSIEILGAQRRTLERVLTFQQYPGLLRVLSDPRIEHLVGDGRAYLNQSRRLFDIIEADALRPSSAYAGNLYSREYFTLLRSRLKPGGFGVTWAPTERSLETFLSVFPHALAFPGDILIGSESPIPYDLGTLERRIAEARTYYEATGLDIRLLLQPHLATPPRVFGPDASRGFADFNSDLFPRDEFALPFW